MNNSISNVLKSAVLTYGKSEKYFPNIGDYIQSLAAAQYIEGDFITIDREQLDEYGGDEVKLICNGWFMSDSEHWPPSDKIHPLFVAFHITPDAKANILSEEGIAYLKRYEPIGCRDRDTMYLLKEHNISAYFSGCLTLTLSKSYSPSKKRERIYFVDPQITRPRILDCISSIYYAMKHISVISKLLPKIERNYFVKYNGLVWRFLYTCIFYRQYSSFFSDELLVNAEFISHEKELPDATDVQASFEYASSLLEKYSSAALVVTSRIHCALPCASFSTPCFFVDRDGLSQKRFDGLIELLNVLKLEGGTLFPLEKCCEQLSNLSDGKFTLSSRIKPKTEHFMLSQNLSEEMYNFFSSS